MSNIHSLLFYDSCPHKCAIYGLTKTDGSMRFCNGGLPNNFGSAVDRFRTVTSGKNFWDNSHYYCWYHDTFNRDSDFTRMMKIDDLIVKSKVSKIISKNGLRASYKFDTEVFDTNKVSSTITPGIFDQDLFCLDGNKQIGMFHSTMSIPLPLINSASVSTLFGFTKQEELDEYLQNLDLLI